MREIEKEELSTINGGGISFNGTIINAISGLTKIILEVGRSLGSSLRRNISMVFQDNFLYSGTIKENILMGNPTAVIITRQPVSAPFSSDLKTGAAWRS